MMARVDVLNIPLHDGSLNSAVDYIVHTCTNSQEKLNRLVSATGAHGLVTAEKDSKFAAVLNSFHCNLPDGMPTVWVGRLKGSKSMERCYGPDVFAEVMVRSAGEPIRHFLCGGKEGVAETLKDVCEKTFSNHSCVGTYCPPFRQMTSVELDGLADDINCKDVDIVWIGLSTPKQELFAWHLAKRIDVHFIVTVGAAFDFHIGAVRQAPHFVRRAGLEWLFRLCIEPRRLYRRYMEVVPLFVYLNIRELWFYVTGGRSTL